MPNFGIPAKVEPTKPGPSPDRDLHYKLTKAAKGRNPSNTMQSMQRKYPYQNK